MENQTFKIPSENWEKINLESAKNILQFAETKLKYLLDVSDRITNRAFAILSILIPITSALITFLVNNINQSKNLDYTVYLLLFDIIFLVLVMYKLTKIIMPRTFMALGREPNQICTDSYLGLDPNNSEFAQLNLTLSSIENCQYKIDFNKNQNLERHTLLESSMKIIIRLFTVNITVILLVCLWAMYTS